MPSLCATKTTCDCCSTFLLLRVGITGPRTQSNNHNSRDGEEKKVIHMAKLVIVASVRSSLNECYALTPLRNKYARVL